MPSPLPVRARLELFTPAARGTLVRAAVLAQRTGRSHLGTDALLVALAERSEVAPVLARLGATRTAVREAVRHRWGWDPGADGRSLVAADTAGWYLDRSWLRPNRLRLIGPQVSRVLSRSNRRVIEAALERSGHRGIRAGDADLLRALLADPRNRGSQALSTLRVCFTSLIDHLDAVPRLAA
jgi:hypothetical protein